MEWSDDGIILRVTRHGESDVVLDALTPSNGRWCGYVKGGAGRRKRGELQVGIGQRYQQPHAQRHARGAQGTPDAVGHAAEAQERQQARRDEPPVALGPELNDDPGHTDDRPGADPSIRDQWNRTALDYALRRGANDPIARMIAAAETPD